MHPSKTAIRFSLLVLVLFFSATLFSAERLTVKKVDLLFNPISLEKNLLIYEDTTNTANPSFLLKNLSQFKPLVGFKGKNPTNAYYLTFSMTNSTPERIELALLFQNLTYVQLYVVRNGKVTERRVSGFFCKADSISRTDTRTHFEVDLEAADSVRFLIRVKHTKHQIPIFNFALQDNSHYDKASSSKQKIDFFFFGAFVIFFLSSVLSFSINHNRLYLWLAIYSFGISFYVLSVNGYLINILAPNHAPEMWWLNVIFPNAASFGALMLIQDFIKLKKNKPRLYHWLRGITLGVIVQLVASLIIGAITSNYLWLTWINVIGNCAENGIALIIITSIWKGLQRPQRLFIIGATGHILLMIMASALFAVVKERSLPILSLMTDIGGIIVISFYTISLSENTRLSEIEKYQALKALDALILVQNKRLEDKVALRTNELQEANLSLLKQREELEHRNEKIEILLKENHHRVKNNLQLISSLLELHLVKNRTEKFASIIADAKNRVNAMSLIHQMLFQNDNDAIIDMEKYIHLLLEQVGATQTIPLNTVITVECNDVLLDLDTAIPVGLIINELVTNVFKYAIDCSAHPKLAISLQEVTTGEYLLTVSDSGPGLPENYSTENVRGLGLYLIPRLCKQLQGSFTYHFREGAEFIVTFKNRGTRKQTM